MAAVFFRAQCINTLGDEQWCLYVGDDIVKHLYGENNCDLIELNLLKFQSPEYNFFL